MKIAAKLLVCAGTLMLTSGAIFGFLGQWIYAALLLTGAFCCLVAALNSGKQKNGK
jgi:hypothetical protein